AQTVTSMTMIQALRSAMDIMLERDDDVVVFGQDVGYFGGVFRCTEGLQKKYGTSRVFDAPISESGIIGAAVGMGAYGECGSTTNNEERQKQVDFSVGIFEVGTRLLSKKTANIKDFDDLKGKNVVTTAGTTSERLLKAMNADKKMGMNIISAKDHGESFMMLESGRAVAFMMDDALLYGEMAKAKKPDDWVVGGTPQSFEIYGCMVRKGDAAFKKVVDKAITDTYASGEVNKIYDKWFTQPIPPKGLNLNFPMSEELKKLIASPTDKAAEQM
ncbi:transporter substrate-binding domain-containing protein, partial [Pseudomonas aeruginosa]|uniref:transporter substrate-binding domain-containing protein n=1 Tax=Pseudomonas aeruginosa TaxID=287 RepID=UPI001F2B88CD